MGIRAVRTYLVKTGLVLSETHTKTPSLFLSLRPIQVSSVVRPAGGGGGGGLEDVYMRRNHFSGKDMIDAFRPCFGSIIFFWLGYIMPGMQHRNALCNVKYVSFFLSFFTKIEHSQHMDGESHFAC